MTKSPLLSILIAFFAMLSAGIMARMAVQTFERGPIPEKQLTSASLGASDALSTLRNAGGAITVAIGAAGGPLHNLFVSTVTLKNTGYAPILPTDIYGNIRLKTSAPWQIIAVTNGLQGGVSFDWRKVNDAEFLAEPALINPGDLIWATVYLTYPDDRGAAPDNEIPPLEWDARISNLKAILTDSQNTSLLASGPLVVFITSWGIFSIILSFLIYFGLYLQLLHLNRFLSPWRIQSLVLVAGTGVVSLCAAEAGNAYIIGPTIYLPQVDHLLNLPVLIFNLVLLGMLYFMGRQRQTN